LVKKLDESRAFSVFEKKPTTTPIDTIDFAQTKTFPCAVLIFYLFLFENLYSMKVATNFDIKALQGWNIFTQYDKGTPRLWVWWTYYRLLRSLRQSIVQLERSPISKTRQAFLDNVNAINAVDEYIFTLKNARTVMQDARVAPLLIQQSNKLIDRCTAYRDELMAAVQPFILPDMESPFKTVSPFEVEATRNKAYDSHPVRKALLERSIP